MNGTNLNILLILINVPYAKAIHIINFKPSRPYQQSYLLCAEDMSLTNNN